MHRAFRSFVVFGKDDIVFHWLPVICQETRYIASLQDFIFIISATDKSRYHVDPDPVGV